MINTFLTNESLEKFIEKSPALNENEKKELLNKIPYLGKEDRIFVLDSLKDLTLLDLEKKEAIEKMRRIENWREEKKTNRKK